MVAVKYTIRAGVCARLVAAITIYTIAIVIIDPVKRNHHVCFEAFELAVNSRPVHTLVADPNTAVDKN